MRHFTSVVDQSCTYVLDDTTNFTDPAFVRIQQSLVITMGANPLMMSPSEDAVLADFIGWVMHNLECSFVKNGDMVVVPKQARLLAKVVRPVFAYHNLNEGHSVVVVWVDSKAKSNFLSA